jgi:hypothetical protein
MPGATQDGSVVLGKNVGDEIHDDLVLRDVHGSQRIELTLLFRDVADLADGIHRIERLLRSFYRTGRHELHADAVRAVNPLGSGQSVLHGDTRTAECAHV